MTLESITPETAIDLYLDSRKDELAESTHNSHRKRLKPFERWCELEGVGDLNELSGRDLHNYRLWRRDDGDLNNVSLKTQLSTLRVFMKFLESIDGVTPRLHEKIMMPDVSKGENARNVKIEPERAIEVLDYLRTYEYATPSHVAFELAWHTGMRIGALRGLNIDSFHEEDAYLEVLHRPDYDAPLKNKESSERLVGLSGELCRLLTDYIENQRVEVKDEDGRAPLLATENGRAAYTTIRRWIYKMTRPCEIGDDCPEGRNPVECDAATHTRAYECPFNVSPHAVRRGAITYHLLQDWPEGDVSGRMDVSPDVIKDHYDRRTNRELLEQRRENLRKL